MNIVIIDNFYENPDVVRDLALKAKYIDVTQLNYPGYQSLHNYASAAVRKKFEKSLGINVVLDPEAHTFGKFRIMLKETGSQLKIHLDGNADWTGVLYLNPDQDCLGGTGFYRHKRTGLDGPTKMQNWKDVEKKIIEPDTLNSQAWELSSFVGMKFNRLVLFRGNQLFHCHTESFGTSIENSRLTQNFFFNEAPHV